MAWKKYPMDVRPDLTCDSKRITGYTAYIWNCHDGRRIVIHQAASELIRFSAVREKVACGEKTKFEQENDLNDKDQYECLPAESTFWNSSLGEPD